MKQLIMTAVGADRPGLVADLTKPVHALGANLTTSRMVNLGGHFALVALIDGAPDVLSKVQASLSAEAGTLGLSLSFFQTERDATTAPLSVPYRLKTYSMDQPGIVARVSECLRAHSVNVEELSTRVESAPFAGTPLFLLEATVTVPKGVSLKKLRGELESLGEGLGCDVDLDPA